MAGSSDCQPSLSPRTTPLGRVAGPQLPGRSPRPVRRILFRVRRAIHCPRRPMRAAGIEPAYWWDRRIGPLEWGARERTRALTERQRLALAGALEHVA